MVLGLEYWRNITPLYSQFFYIEYIELLLYYKSETIFYFPFYLENLSNFLEIFSLMSPDIVLSIWTTS